MWDIPYVKKEASGPEVVAAMAISCEEVTNLFGSKRDAMSLGIQILAGCNEEAIAVANATGFDLIRAEGFVFASQTAKVEEVEEAKSASNLPILIEGSSLEE
ncbi:unnamed protein product, partial [Mesorhabditis spiculigera]